MGKRPKLWEIWAESELKAKNIQIFAVFLAVLLTVETLSFGFYLLKPKPIYYINGNQGFAFPVKSNTKLVKIFTEGFVADLSNYTPSTIDNCYQEIFQLCSPKCLAHIKISLLNEKKLIKDNAVSSLFAFKSIQIKKIGNGWKIKIQGKHSLYIGGQEIKNGLYQYNIKVIKTTPTAGNPLGIMVDKVSGRFIGEKG